MHDLSVWARVNDANCFHRKFDAFDLLTFGTDGHPLGVEWRILGPGYGVETRGVCATVAGAKDMAERTAASWEAFRAKHGRYPAPPPSISPDRGLDIGGAVSS